MTACTVDDHRRPASATSTPTTRRTTSRPTSPRPSAIADLCTSRRHARLGPGLGRDRRDRPGAAPSRGVVVGDYEGQPPACAVSTSRTPTGDGEPGHLRRHLRLQRRQPTSSHLGDVVTVSGTVGEFEGQTQISTQATVAVCGTGHRRADRRHAADGERRRPSRSTRACSCTCPQELSVTEHFQLGRFGQVTVSSGGRLRQPTNVVAPGAAAIALQAAERPQPGDHRRHAEQPEPRPDHLRPRRPAAQRRRTPCAVVTPPPAPTGVMTYTWAGNAGQRQRLPPAPGRPRSGAGIDFERREPAADVRAGRRR